MEKNIDKIVKLLKKESQKWKYPFVSDWARIVKDPFTTLISCILSLRTKDEITAKASMGLLKKYNTPTKLLELSNEQIEKLIYPVGFYRTKAKRIKEISKTLIEKYNGKVPRTEEELLSIKGIGRKTCNIVRLFAYNELTLPIDVNCHRIANRLGWVKTKTADETEFALKKILPKRDWPEFNTLFILFGKNICVPISPFCSKCPVKNFCKRTGVIKNR